MFTMHITKMINGTNAKSMHIDKCVHVCNLWSNVVRTLELLRPFRRLEDTLYRV